MPRKTVSVLLICGFPDALFDDNCSLASSCRIGNGKGERSEDLSATMTRNGNSECPAAFRRCFLATRQQLHTVQIFFLQEPDCHHTILLEPAIKFTAIDSQSGCGAYLVFSKLLQHRENIALLDLSEWNRVVHVSLKHLPEIVGTRLRRRCQNLWRQIRDSQLVFESYRQRILDRVLEFADVPGPRIITKSAHRFVRESSKRLAVSLRLYSQEMIDQQLYVSTTGAKLGHVQRKNSQSVVKVR